MRFALVATAILLVTQTALGQKQTTISTWQDDPNPGDGGYLLWGWGGQYGAGGFTDLFAAGQTFVLGQDDQRLDQLSLKLANDDECYPAPILKCDFLFQVFLAKWDTATSTLGPTLWSSAEMSFADLSGPSIVVNPRIGLNNGVYATYVLATTGGASIPPGYSDQLFSNFYYMTNVTEYGPNGEVLYEVIHYPHGDIIYGSGAPGNVTWRVVQGDDLYLDAAFTTTPEPATLLLLGSGIAGLAAAARRRKRRKET